MFTSLVLSTLLQFNFNPTHHEVPQLDCEDGIRFSQSMESNLSAMTNWAQRLREVAIQASNGAIGNNKRGFLNAEYQAIADEMFRILDSARFQDVFHNNYAYFRDGYEFDLRVIRRDRSFGHLKRFEFQPFTKTILGGLHERTLKLRSEWEPSLLTVLPYFVFELNGHEIASRIGDDTESPQARAALSATSVVAAIRGSLGHFNNSFDTAIIPAELPLSFLEPAGVLEEGDLFINDVSILGRADDISSLVALINQYHSETGISASREGATDLFLRVRDGRNIEVEFSERLMKSFDIESSHLFSNGAVRILSDEPVLVRHVSGWEIFENFDGQRESLKPDMNLMTSNVLSTSSAADSIAVVNRVLSQLTWRRMDASIPAQLCKGI